MTTVEFNNRLKELDQQLAAVLGLFEQDTNVFVHSLFIDTDEEGNYHMTTGLTFPEE